MLVFGRSGAGLQVSCYVPAWPPAHPHVHSAHIYKLTGHCSLARTVVVLHTHSHRDACRQVEGGCMCVHGLS